MTRHIAITHAAYPVNETATDMEIAEEIISMLAEGEPWVRLWHVDGHHKWYSEWVVMSRHPDGSPDQVAAHEFDGTMTLLSNPQGSLWTKTTCTSCSLTQMPAAG